MARSDFGGLRVLLVDDELFIRRLVERLLSALGIHDIVAAANCQEAVQLLNAEGGRFDFAVVDVEMTRVDGFRLINTIRQGQAGPTADMPVVILTGQAQSLARSQAGRMGANAVLVKPMTREQLEESIIKALALSER